MKKSLCVSLVLAAGAFAVFADAFTGIIQDLAIQTACIGQYSATQAGGGWYDDPHDYYTPQMMAERFAKMSGNMTRTATFYGVCFDYAQFAWDDITRYKSLYNEQGMYEGQFWVAGVNSNPNQIELMSIAKSGESYTREQNGVPIKTYPSSVRNVKTHRLMNKGDRATNHAWLWIERADGVWFWIDPTWTDNLGYVVYGYVKNGEEIQCRPDKEFCINYPSELDSLPLPPSMGARMAPSTSANSTNRNETIKNAGTDWIEAYIETMSTLLSTLDYSFISLLASTNVPFSSFADRSLNINRMAFGLELPALRGNGFFIPGLEYLRNINDDNSIHGALFTLTGADKLNSFLSWYLGYGIGLRFDTSNDNYVPGKTKYLAQTGWFAFKADMGFLLDVSKIFYMKIGAAYDNVLGFSTEAGIGFGIKRQ